MTVPRLPITRSRLPTADRLAPYLKEIDQNRRHANFGPLLQRFVAALESHVCDGRVALAASGSLGLMLALKASGVEGGGLCAMPSWTYAATPAAACAAGLTPWFLDVDQGSWALDPDQIRRRLGDAPGSLAAVVVVAPFEQPADVTAWDAFSEATGLAVVIDAANGFDALSVGRSPTMVSLHATKAFGIGEGGLVASLDEDMIRRIHSLANHGFTGPDEVGLRGLNAKHSEYAAAIGLAAFDEWPKTRAAFLALRHEYRQAFSGFRDVALAPDGEGDRATSTFNVRLPVDAGRVVAALNDRGIEARRWWVDGCHRHPAYADCPRLDLPVTERLARHVVGRPSFWAWNQAIFSGSSMPSARQWPGGGSLG